MMQMISAKASRRELVRHFATLTPERVLNDGGYPSLARLKKENKPEAVETALAILIIDASRAFDTPLDRETAMEIALEVHTRYYYITLEECYMVLQRMKSKPAYGKLNMNKYLQEFEAYSAQRTAMADDMSYNRHLGTSDAGTNRGNETYSIKQLIKKTKR